MKILYALCTSMLVLFAAVGAFAQKTGFVRGALLDADTKEPLGGAAVRVGALAVSCDYDSGYFSIELPAGKHEIEFSLLGYQTQTQAVEVQAGQTLVLNQTLSEEGVTILDVPTVTSSRFEKPLGEVTVSLELVRPDLLQNTNTIAVNEVLGKVPGVNMMDDQVDIRGGAGYAQGTGSRVMILMDDMPILQADAGLPNWRDLPTENIAQIEVLKGAASALYGSAALNGIINIRTAYPTKEPVTKASVFYTTYGAPRDTANKWWDNTDAPYESGAQFSHRRQVGKMDVVYGANFYTNSSYIRGGGVDSTPNYDHKVRQTLHLRYRYSDRLTFALNTNLNLGRQNRHLFWRQQLGGSLYESDPTSIPIRGNSFRITFDPSMTYFDKNTGRHRVQARYFRIRNSNANLQSNSSHYIYGEYQYQRRFANLKNLDFTTGVVGSHTSVMADVYGSNTFGLTNAAFYAQADKKFFERLSVSVGVRYEYNLLSAPDSVAFGTRGRKVAAGSQQEGKPVLRIGTNYQLTEGTFLRASWGQGYRFPTILEKYVSTSAGGILRVYPNPGLTSETGWSGEIGIKQGFKVGKWQGFVDLAGFWTEYQNMTEFQANATIFGFWVQNVGDTRITGLDGNVAGRGKFGDLTLDLLAGYTYINPIYQNFDSLTRESTSSEKNVLKYRFRHSGKVDMQLTYKKFGLGGNLQYYSFMEAIDKYLDDRASYPTIPTFRDTHNNGSYLLSLRASYTHSFARLTLLVNNALNTEFSVRPGVLEAPRNLSIRADLTF